MSFTTGRFTGININVFFFYFSANYFQTAEMVLYMPNYCKFEIPDQARNIRSSRTIEK
jgi:hypothetical protein